MKCMYIEGPAAPPSGPGPNTVLFVGFEGSATDASAHAHPIALYGSPSFGGDANGGYLLLNGSTQFAMVEGNQADWAFGTGDFGVMVWCATTAGFGGIVSPGAPGLWNMLINNGNFYWQNFWNQANLISESIGSSLDGSPLNLYVCRVSGEVRFFLNGVLVEFAPDCTNYSATTDLYVGHDAATQPFNGKLYGIRIDKGSAPFTSNYFTPPPAP